MPNLSNKIEQNKEKYVIELAEFCNQPSVAAEDRGTREMVGLVSKRLKKLGAEVQIVTVNSSHRYILAELKAKTNSDNKKTVLIYNHYDVQPEGTVEKWHSEPFKLTLKGDKAFARGVADNKGDMLCRIQAVELMLSQNNDLPVNIKWVIEGEEEIGSIHLPQLQQEYGNFWKDCAVCIWEDGAVDGELTPKLPLGMKGILYVELSCEFNENDLHSRNATVVDSPVWHLLNALNTLRNEKGEVLVEGFYDDALQPTPEETKIMEVEDFTIENLVEGASEAHVLIKNDTKLQALNKLYYKGTANICGIWAGNTKEGSISTSIPNKAYAKLDFRLVPNQKPKDILEKLRKHFDKRGFQDVKVNEMVSLECSKTKIENEYVQKCIKVLKEGYGKEPVITIVSLGGGPEHNVSGVYNIPTVRLGVGYPDTRIHGPNENIRISDYLKSIEIFVKYLEEVAK